MFREKQVRETINPVNNLVFRPCLGLMVAQKCYLKMLVPIYSEILVILPKLDKSSRVSDFSSSETLLAMIFGILFLTVLVRSSPMNSLGQYYYDYTENSPLIDPNLTPYDPSMSPNMTDNISPRRFKDLDKMIKEINPEFDSRKYWAYGCHCFALNDRPSSSMGRGKPVDELDTLCKKYKECQKCAQKRFGEVIKIF